MYHDLHELLAALPVSAVQWMVYCGQDRNTGEPAVLLTQSSCSANTPMARVTWVRGWKCRKKAQIQN